MKSKVSRPGTQRHQQKREPDRWKDLAYGLDPDLLGLRSVGGLARTSEAVQGLTGYRTPGLNEGALGLLGLHMPDRSEPRHSLADRPEETS